MMNFYSKQKFWFEGICLLNLMLKVCVLWLSLSFTAAMADDHAADTPKYNQTCPEDFYSLPLYPNAKYCQLFAEELPASLSYFALSDQQTAKTFYLEKLGQAEAESMLKGRIVLQYAKGQKVVIISKDGQGSQVDILVKSTS